MQWQYQSHESETTMPWQWHEKITTILWQGDDYIIAVPWPWLDHDNIYVAMYIGWLWSWQDYEVNMTSMMWQQHDNGITMKWPWYDYGITFMSFLCHCHGVVIAWSSHCQFLIVPGLCCDFVVMPVHRINTNRSSTYVGGNKIASHH